MPQGSRVAVIRLRSLGDCVLTTPALEILKRNRPDLEVGMAVEDRFAAVFEGNADVDRILAPGIKEVRAWRPWLCLNLHGGTRSALLTACSGARVRAGFGHYRFASVYNLRIPRAQQILGAERTVHTAEHLASAIFHLGAQRCEIPAARLSASRRGPEAIAIIHPVASSPAKTWPAERFLLVAEYLKARCDLEPVFVAAHPGELLPFTAYRTLAGAPLAEIKNLLARASLFIGNDSGPAHMAAALRLPVIVLFGASDPSIWGPWKATGEALSSPAGIASIAPDEVIAALGRLRVCA